MAGAAALLQLRLRSHVLGEIQLAYGRRDEQALGEAS
jgi:hypothetical protein